MIQEKPKLDGIDGLDFNPPCQRCSENPGTTVARLFLDPHPKDCRYSGRRWWLCGTCMTKPGRCRGCNTVDSYIAA